MKKLYVCPEVIDSVEIQLEHLINDSGKYSVTSDDLQISDGVTEGEDEAGAAMRGGSSDFGSLW